MKDFIRDRLVMFAKEPQRSLCGAETSLSEFERTENIILSDRQRQAIKLMLQSSIVVLDGGVSTGKTTALRAAYHVLESITKGDVRQLIIGGQAAQRLYEETGRPVGRNRRFASNPACSS